MKTNIILSIFACAVFITALVANRAHIAPKQDTTVNIVIDYTDYELCLSHIKEMEGFRATSDSKEGQPLVGYGFSKWVYDGKTITKQQADSVLRYHFDQKIRLAYQLTQLSGRKLLAVACLLYNLKPGSVEKSSLPGAIMRHDSTEIRNCWLSFSCFKGKRLPGLEKRRRLWEYNFFNSK